ncbi:hypothetical protein TraAM80_06205 [Trypanosoma rangeli]|uniref:Cytochrome b5 heme-binding domain-containing protein n=1 Tax=Trypanosoma rangeli TaxID=5698 RepID=A0A3R7KWD3_TRYRA|nr:uncharacterized protein TraAM80_06205 [Trypanosoma rangeli]RNF02683.1 hypothetical protein TraAM80_06205 [Trypanosoma rangeli]|eukprot:RNF02683.1 hypothetical protein TraAM80_06205 [Trypanosoma rangeli]
MLQGRRPYGRLMLLTGIWVILAAVFVRLALTPYSDDRKNAGDTNHKDDVGNFFASAGGFRCPPVAYFAREEVARHASESNLWMVVDGNVLDVSSFVQQHPGGLLIVEGAGGHDAAALFSEFHLPSTVKLLEKYCIGRLNE